MSWSCNNRVAKEKRPVGRPKEPLFSSAAEEDFIRRASVMIERYYKPVPNMKQDFVFDAVHKISKTKFWSLVYIYFVKERKMKENMQGFVSFIHLHFGHNIISDRTSVYSSVMSLMNQYVHLEHIREKENEKDRKKQEDLRDQYQTVKRLWLEASLSLTT